MTTLNRFITFTQSWLAKTSLIFFVSAFILFSCGDDLNTIGFKPDENRFKVSYKEIELPSSVFLSGPVITSNHGGDGLTPRVLVGNYTDDKFGKIGAEGYLQFRPISTNAAVPANATLESLILNLSFDYYHYGSADPVNMDFSIHPLIDSLITEQNYYNNSNIAYSSTPIGQGTYGVSPTGFDDKYKLNTDGDATNNAMDTLSISLDRSYAESLFQSAKANTNDYILFNKFRRTFKGLVVRSSVSNQIIGFDPTYLATGTARSRMVLYYNYTDDAGAAKKGKVEFVPFADAAGFGTVSFSKITADRTGTPFQDININDVYKEFFPDGDNRFIESGYPIATKFDISNFFLFSDTITNMLINSAELVIDPIETQTFKAPNYLVVRPLNTKGRFLTTSDTLSTSYKPFILSDKDSYLILGQGSGTNAVARTLILGQADDKSYLYKGAYTSYFQALYSLSDKTKRVRQYALIPGDPGIGKSVNRLVFNKDKLKLKIYYTIPSTKKEE